MAKLLNAPNMKAQPSKADSVKILVGSQAWDFAKAPQAEQSADEIALNEVLPITGGNIPPIVLAGENLSQIDRLRIAPETVREVIIQRANQAEPLPETLITQICYNLAKHTVADCVVMIDEAGQPLENLSAYVERVRTGETVAEIVVETAQKHAQSREQERADKQQPYIEKRTTDGKTGLFRIIPKYDNSTGEPILISESEQWLCDSVDVIGIGRSESEDFIVLEWQPEGSFAKVREAIPLKDLGEREGWRLMKQRGLKLTTKTALRNELADHLQNSGNRTLWTITNATGWQNGAYILPNGEVIGTPESPVLFRSQSATFAGYDTKGTAQSWRNEVADYVAGNPSMMLGLAVAFASPIIGLIEAESFGVHLFGGSSAGKTTTANIASSLYGHADKIRLSWNATSLGLQNEASSRNDGFMPLDEIGQTAGFKAVEQTAYALFNGVGKIQGAKEGGNREIQRWRIMAFSTGEIDLEGYLASKGVKIHAGQLVRLLNVPISPAKRYHGLADGKAHADHLNQASKQHYGVAGREWIEWLSHNSPQVAESYEQHKAKWIDRLPNDASPQVRRVATRFAILETALQLSQFLTGWQAETISEALLHSFHEWINIFGLHSKEEQQVIDQVNGWLLANAEGRFIRYPFDDRQPQIHNIAGYRMLAVNGTEREHFYLYPLAFDEAIKGNPKEQASQILADKGMLAKGEGNYKYLKRLPHKVDEKRTRCYVLFPIIEQDEDDSEEADE